MKTWKQIKAELLLLKIRVCVYVWVYVHAVTNLWPLEFLLMIAPWNAYGYEESPRITVEPSQFYRWWNWVPEKRNELPRVSVSCPGLAAQLGLLEPRFPSTIHHIPRVPFTCQVSQVWVWRKSSTFSSMPFTQATTGQTFRKTTYHASWGIILCGAKYWSPFFVYTSFHPRKQLWIPVNSGINTVVFTVPLTHHFKKKLLSCSLGKTNSYWQRTAWPRILSMNKLQNWLKPNLIPYILSWETSFWSQMEEG